MSCPATSSFVYYKHLTCLYGLKESNFLFGQSPKQLDFHSACAGTDGTKQEPPSAACTHRANQSIKDKVSQILPVSHRNMLMDECGGKHCPIPPQRVQAHEEDCRYEFIRLVLTAKDVNDSPSVERDEHLT